MGEVWLAEDPLLHRQGAIKTLPAHSQDDHEYSCRFEREAQAAAALNHPHILPVHSYGEQPRSDGQIVMYIVMSYIAGGSLAERITAYTSRQMMMPPQEAITYLSQAAEAIDYAHSRGVIHRDIKPGNMLLRSDNWLLLADFGIARMVAQGEQLTKTGVGFGTPEYMAPEQARGELNYDALRSYIGPTAWSPARSLLVGTDNGEKLTVWDVKSSREIAKITLPRSFATLSKHISVVVLRNALVWSPLDQHLVAAANVDVVALCDIRQSEPFLLLGTDDPDLRKTPAAFPNTGPWIGSVFGIAWSPNGRFIAASYTCGPKVYVWDLQERVPRTTQDGARLTSSIFGTTGGHSSAIVDLQWSPNGRYLATASYDKTVMVWKVDKTS